MWPVLVQLLKLAPHMTRLAPVADRYLQTRAEGRDSERRAVEHTVDGLRGDLAQTAERMQGDLTQVNAAQAAMVQQLEEQSETLAGLASDMRATRLRSDEIEVGIKAMEARMARLWMILIAGIVVLAILAAVMIAMLLHMRQSLHGS
jgi:septal ring factor EnvC (AmiA/AmiB activator)